MLTGKRTELNTAISNNSNTNSILILLMGLFFMTDPNTYICNPAESHLHPIYNINYNANGVSCPPFGSQVIILGEGTNTNQHGKFNNAICEHHDYLFNLFHTETGNADTYSVNNIYFCYYQCGYIHSHKNLFKNVWKQMAKMAISWKFTTVFISITDTLMLLVLKYLIFEDNYNFDADPKHDLTLQLRLQKLELDEDLILQET